jgi:hypothetical protein
MIGFAEKVLSYTEGLDQVLVFVLNRLLFADYIGQVDKFPDYFKPGIFQIGIKYPRQQVLG